MGRVNKATYFHYTEIARVDLARKYAIAGTTLVACASETRSKVRISLRLKRELGKHIGSPLKFSETG